MKYYAHVFRNYEIILCYVYLTAILAPLNTQTIGSNLIPPDIDRCWAGAQRLLTE